MIKTRYPYLCQILAVTFFCLLPTFNNPAYAEPFTNCLNDSGNPGASDNCSTSQGAASQETNTSSAAAANPINVMNGNKYQQEQDMAALPGELGLELVRHYNSSMHAYGYTGYGWRLSYETELFAIGSTIQIVQADGARIIYTRDHKDPTKCTPNDPARGTVIIHKTPRGDEYTWVWANGRTLYFNTKGKLERITSATGNTVNLLRGPKGALLKVTDPQGRSMTFEYAPKHSKGFRGIMAVNTPLGRYEYQHNHDRKSDGFGNLLSVAYPNETLNADSQSAAVKTIAKETSHIVRAYHYAENIEIDANKGNAPTKQQAAHWLTGITVKWQDKTGKAKKKRTNTWVYNAQGRGVLSVLGPYDPTANKPSLGQTTIAYDNPEQYTANDTAYMQSNLGQGNQVMNTTTLTNSLGQKTVFKHTVIAGQYRMVEVLGAGCSSCPPTNMRYRYDNLAREIERIQLTPSGQAIASTRKHYDKASRITRIEQVRYQNGQAQTAQLIKRFEYPLLPQAAANATNASKNRDAAKLNKYIYAVYNKPILIAAPSVVKGQEHQWHITYNDYGQPLKVTETGYRPAIPFKLNQAKSAQTQQMGLTQAGTEKTKISRSVSYQYTKINGRSLLSQTDGPLPNGKTNTPTDSDITTYTYDKRGRYLLKVIAPGNITAQYAYDVEGNSAAIGGTGRLIKTMASNSLATTYRYDRQGRLLQRNRYPASLSLASAKQQGLLQASINRYDVFGKPLMIKRVDGQAITMQYSEDNQLIAMRDHLGNRVEWKDWNLAPHEEGEAVTTQQWYTAGAPDKVARAWYFWRDAQNRLTKRLSPSGGLDTWQYSQADKQPSTNRWVQHIDPLNRMVFQATNGQASAQINTTSDGYLSASFNGYGLQSNTKKDNQAEINQFRQPLQLRDDFGRVIQFDSHQHGKHIAAYNLASRMSKIKQPDGTVIDYQYDVAGRLLQKTASKEKQTSTISYQYNAFGLQTVIDAMQTTQYTRDLLGREIDKAISLKLNNGTQKTYHIRTRYDDKGRIKAKQTADGQWLVFELDNKTGLTNGMTLHDPIWPSLTNKLADWFNAPELPLQIATKQTIANHIKVHPFNGITQLTHGNGIETRFDFDLAGRLVAVQHGEGAQTNNKANIMYAQYQYDAMNRLTAEKTQLGNLAQQTKDHAYQGWNQLATAPKAGYQQANFNQAKVKPTIQQPITIKTQPQSQADVQIDTAGRVINDGQYRYQYQSWGRITTVSNQQQQALVHYAYNAWGERIMAKPVQTNHKTTTAENNLTRYYLYDQQKRVAELDQAGNIVQQYYYINNLPVAVLNTPNENQAHVSNPEGLMAIHTDRRHAPAAVTDEQGNVIWQASYNAWGRATKVALNKDKQSEFDLSLRLPGQWEDETTHIHYNYQRDYNPDTGRYLTPDPLGFPDGPDPYAYVNNDPLNKLDPLGLYQSDIHYYMTFFLAVAAGVDKDEARVIALAAQYIDDNPETRPLDPDKPLENIGNDEAIKRLAYYHITQTAEDDPERKIYYPTPEERAAAIRAGYPDPGNAIPENLKDYTERRVIDPENDQLERLLSVSSKAPSRCAKLQFFGEYLHAFADTFAHRDSNNIPIAIQNGVGHGAYNSNPDYTYNHTVFFDFLPLPGHVDWDNNESRTLQMELEMFAKLTQFASGDDVISSGKITQEAFEIFLGEFNALHEHEGKGYEKGKGKAGPSGDKIKKLQEKLEEWFGVGVINIRDLNNAAYNETLAAENRTRFLCEGGKPLDQTAYEGTILPSSCN